MVWELTSSRGEPLLANRGLATGASAAVANRIAPRLIPLPSAIEREVDLDPIPICPDNVSVVVDETVVVKWLQPSVPAPHRGAQLWAHLAEVGFDEMPAFHGVDEIDCRVVAVLTGFVADSLDGWHWYVDLLTEELEGGNATRSIGVASRLGALAARMHRALATPSAVIPLPVGWGDARDELDRGMRLLDVAVGAASGGFGERLASRCGRISDAIGDVAVDRPIDVQPIHGDLHVGRMLRTRDRIVVTGFDDAPVDEVDGRAALRSPMIDLASLVQSVGHVGRLVATVHPQLSSGALDFIAEATEAVIAAYGRIAEVDEALLTPLRTIRELQDYILAAERFPGWQCVPDAALCAMFP